MNLTNQEEQPNRPSRPKVGAKLELRIESVAFGGEGLARHDGLVVMVRGGLPGDVVNTYVSRRHKNHVEAKIESIVEPSPHRIEPRCAHFAYCGGCAWQHFVYAEQLRWKERHVREHFERIAGIADPPILPIAGMDDTWRYRNKMEYAFSQFGDGRLKLGLHSKGRFDVIIDIDDCHLQPATCNDLRNCVREIGRERNFSTYNVRRHEGMFRHFVIRTARRGESLMGIFSTLDSEFQDGEEIAKLISNRFPAVDSLMWHVNTTRGGAAVAGKGKLLAGADRLHENVLGLTLEVSSISFMQTNTLQCERLYTELLDACELDGSETVLDLYTGAGPIALLLASRAKRVIGLESVGEAVADARRNAELNGIENVEFIEGEVEKELAALCETVSPDTIVLDPPRAGAHKNAIASVIAAAPRQIAYVSCNPSTLARDATELVGAGYKLASVQPVDMFPHTYHIECVARFVR